jgi:hypothetical protein
LHEKKQGEPTGEDEDGEDGVGEAAERGEGEAEGDEEGYRAEGGEIGEERSSRGEVAFMIMVVTLDARIVVVVGC